MVLTPGARLGPYEIVAALGAGGMGEVYRARDTRLGRHVAIKVLPSEVSDSTARERFAREARTVSALSHPNICPLFDVGQQDGRDYLVMECLDGQTLASILEAGALEIARSVRIAAQIADGLAHAHANGVIHRDLKPGNVMVLPGDIVKILDFGLARKAAAPTDATVAVLTQPGYSGGTLAYMSPEQTLAQPLTPQSDVFSLGVVLYEMLAGVRPFGGASAFEVMQQIVQKQPPELGGVRRTLPPQLLQLVNAMMDKSAVDRPDAASVALALRSLAGSSPVNEHHAVAASASTITGMTPAARRARWPALTWIAAASLVVVTAAVGIRGDWIERVWRANEPQAVVETPRTAPDWVRQGRALLGRSDRKRNIDEAITAFSKAIELDGTSAAAYAGLSESYRQKDSVTPDPQLVRQAIDAGQRAVTLNPDLAASHAALGAALLRAKQNAAARDEIDIALDQDSNNVTALLALGELQIDSGQAADAEATYRRAQKAAPDEWVPAQLLGRSLFVQAKYQEAATVWEEADRRTPDNVQILRNLGGVYQMLDRNDEAITALQRALAIEPTATVYNNLGTLRFFQGRYTDAVEAFEKGIALNATFFLYWANLGDAYRWAPGNAEKSKQAYARAITLIDERLRATPDDPDDRTRLAMYLAKFGDLDRAAAELARWQSGGKKTPASYFRALIVHELRGEREQALASLDAAIRAGYATRDIYNEPELTKLRTDPRYHKIVAAHEAAAAR